MGEKVFSVIWMIAAVAAALLATFLPYLPGGYDAFALALSAFGQAIGFAAPLLAMIGWGWLWFRRPSASRWIPLLAKLLLSLFTALAAICVAAASGPSLGVLLAAGLLFAIWRTRGRSFVTPLVLIAAPLAVAAAMFTLGPAAERLARTRAMDTAAPLIRDLEAYRQRHGRYPQSLEASWQDYRPGVIGIRRYHYAAAGDAYDLIFAQPSFVFGTQVYLVYNPRGGQVFYSHDQHILLPRAPAGAGQGWYAVADAERPGWKLFKFD